MNWALRKGNLHMGIGRELGTSLCFLLLLMLLLLENPCFAAGRAKFTRDKKGSSAASNAVRIHRSGYRGTAPDKDSGSDVLGAEKRRVYTGPNPLHNR